MAEGPVAVGHRAGDTASWMASTVSVAVVLQQLADVREHWLQLGADAKVRRVLEIEEQVSEISSRISTMESLQAVAVCRGDHEDAELLRLQVEEAQKEMAAKLEQIDEGMLSIGLPGSDAPPLPAGAAAQVPTPPLDPPRLLPEDLGLDGRNLVPANELRLGEKLGAGASGEVFSAQWRGTSVAVKKVTGVTGADIDGARKELKALQALRHPRLVQFLGVALEGTTLFMVTELVQGGSLHDRLWSTSSPPTPLHHWAVALQVVEGIIYLHGQRTVHRDLKPGNILLDVAGNVRICDFGLAHFMSATHLTRQERGEAGTPRYMAPECFSAEAGKLTEKLDIWSMGCILLELFTRRMPYDDCLQLAQLCTRIVVQRKPPEVPVTLPGELQNVIRSCVEFDFAQRPSAWDLGMRLSRARMAR